MRVNINSNGLYSITSMDVETLDVVMRILGHAKERCFREYDDEIGGYLSGDDFCMTLEAEDRQRFQNFVNHFWSEYENMKSRMNLKRKKEAAL